MAGRMTDPFLRPETRAWLRRWGETLGTAAFAALGLWWFATAGDVLAWVGGAVALGGGAASLAAFQRARFRSRGGGVGVLQLDEGRLTYYGPLTGGTIAVREIAAVAIDPRHRPAHWVMSGEGAELLVPIDAEGADVLLDVFAQLPGLDLQTVMAASRRPLRQPATLWWRDKGGAEVPRLR